MEQPNGEDGLVPETTAQFNNDYQKWWSQAKSLTEKEATDEKLLIKEEGIKLSILNAADKDAKDAKGQGVNGNGNGNPIASRQVKRIFARKLDKENRDKRSSNNVIEIDGDITMGNGGNGSSSSPGKRKGVEFDSILENDRDIKIRRNE